jgi:hypothetical protein
MNSILIILILLGFLLPLILDGILFIQVDVDILDICPIKLSLIPWHISQHEKFLLTPVSSLCMAKNS